MGNAFRVGGDRAREKLLLLGPRGGGVCVGGAGTWRYPGACSCSLAASAAFAVSAASAVPLPCLLLLLPELCHCYFHFFTAPTPTASSCNCFRLHQCAANVLPMCCYVQPPGGQTNCISCQFVVMTSVEMNRMETMQPPGGNKKVKNKNLKKNRQGTNPQ